MRKKILSILVLSFLVLLLSVPTFAASDIKLFAENVVVGVEEEIVVPIKLSGNQGICGATFQVQYDEGLVLKNIGKGDALSSLTLTKPGKLSANPFNLVFDGVDEDVTNGVVAYLFFEPVAVKGTYDVVLSYKYGDIVNGRLEALDIDMQKGTVTVQSESGGDDEEEEGDEPAVHDGPVFSFGKAIAGPGGSVDVPIYVSGNTGICGITMKVAYDTALTLTGVTRGGALSSLTFTKPGNLSRNPVNIILDGIEADNTNGLLCTLTFKAPSVSGVYGITATYGNGDIVDGALQPVDVLIEPGTVTVSRGIIDITIGNQNFALPLAEERDGDIYIAFYNSTDKMLSVNAYSEADRTIDLDAVSGAAYAKIFYWSQNMKPLCDFIPVTLQ